MTCGPIQQDGNQSVLLVTHTHTHTNKIIDIYQAVIKILFTKINSQIDKKHLSYINTSDPGVCLEGNVLQMADINNYIL